MPGSAERVLILYTGTEPIAREIKQIIDEVERANGVDVAGARITTYDCGSTAPDALSEQVAKFFVLKLENEGELSPRSLQRAIFRSFVVDSAWGIVVVIRAREPVR